MGRRSKHQDPEKIQAPNPKFQNSRFLRRCVADLGIWSSSGSWCLYPEFGALRLLFLLQLGFAYGRAQLRRKKLWVLLEFCLAIVTAKGHEGAFVKEGFGPVYGLAGDRALGIEGGGVGAGGGGSRDTEFDGHTLIPDPCS